MSDSDDVKDARIRELEKQLSAGQSAVAPRALPEGALEVHKASLEEFADSVSRDAARLGNTDEHPKNDGPSGRLDIVLMRLLEPREDLRGHVYRVFDNIAEDTDKAFIASLVQRRWQEKDRRTNTRETQKVVDIAAAVGVHWANAHRGEQGSKIQLVPPDDRHPHA